ncbi:ABC transporter permease [Ferrimicrobium sp.]|uniref:ABC transporter permease n=1 Tax=Ferrimicrobium sp. TaxID=2926050 RepID=UPI002610E87B|nr:ABC transporter permease [Ferrimicrobium sp.]
MSERITTPATGTDEPSPRTGVTKPSRLRLLLSSPSATAGAIIVATAIIVAIVSIWWTPYGPLAVNTAAEFLRPSLAHPLGTDEYGRDVLSRLMTGTQITLLSSLGAVAIALVVGVPAGLVAAFRRGVTGEIIMRGADLLYSFPALLAAITLVAALGASTLTATLAIGIASIPVFARVTRSTALGILSTDYVLAARAYGRSNFQIARRHVLPNIMPILVAQIALLLSVTILAVAALSYLGLGTPPPAPTWGGMLESAQNYLYQDPLLALWPGLAIAVTVFGLNALGDGLRDLLDPTLKGRS